MIFYSINTYIYVFHFFIKNNVYFEKKIHDDFRFPIFQYCVFIVQKGTSESFTPVF